MRKVYYAAVALVASSVALSPNVLADSQLQMGGGVSAVASAQQTAACSGTVFDEDGEPLPGASIFVEGGNGASTNIDGKFTIPNVKIGSTIKISYVGYEPQSIVWKGEPIEVTLKPTTESLDEVVVVGYGVQKKVNLTGAVSQVKGDDLKIHPVADAAQMLQGMIPGLYVSNGNAGRPGGSASLQLRGQGNLSGTGTPYVLVDGVEMSLSDVNPSDIQSISVLKDAGASAIYGARAAYGVVLVTTRRGEEGKMRVNYSGSVGWNSPTKLPNMLDGYEFAKMWNQGCINAGTARLYSDEKLELLRQFRDNPS